MADSPYGITGQDERNANMFAGATGAGAMFGPWGAAAGLGLELTGGLMAQNAKASTKTIRRRGKYALEQNRARDALFGGLEESALLTGQTAERQGFQGARNALGLQTEIAKQGLTARAAQNRADLEQSFVSNGTLGTSGAVNQLGNQMATSNAQLAAIDAMYGQQLASLGLEESSLLGQQGRERAAMAAKRRDYERSIGEGLFSIYTMG